MKSKLNTAILLPIIYILFSLVTKFWIFFETPNISISNKFRIRKETTSTHVLRAIHNTNSILNINIIDNSAKSIMTY